MKRSFELGSLILTIARVGTSSFIIETVLVCDIGSSRAHKRGFAKISHNEGARFFIHKSLRFVKIGQRLYFLPRSRRLASDPRQSL